MQHEVKEKRSSLAGAFVANTPTSHSPKKAFAHAWCAHVGVDSGALARRAVQAENMAPPSPRESKAPSATSAAKSDEEMVLPGFPDADSFVKVSSRGLRDTGSRPRPAGSRPRTFWQPSARQRAHRSGAPGLGSRRSCPRRAQSHLILQGRGLARGH